MPIDKNDKSAGETELIGQVAGGKLKAASLFNVEGWVAVGESSVSRGR